MCIGVKDCTTEYDVVLFVAALSRLSRGCGRAVWASLCFVLDAQVLARLRFPPLVLCFLPTAVFLAGTLLDINSSLAMADQVPRTYVHKRKRTPSPDPSNSETNISFFSWYPFANLSSTATFENQAVRSPDVRVRQTHLFIDAVARSLLSFRP